VLKPELTPDFIHFFKWTNVSLHFDVILSTDDAGPCISGANTWLKSSAGIISCYFDIIFVDQYVSQHLSADQPYHTWLMSVSTPYQPSLLVTNKTTDNKYAHAV